jgi:steroid delta-isomerase-like uncharacterized protein
MSTEENEAVIRRFWDAFNQHDLDTLEPLMAPDFKDYDPTRPGPVDRAGRMQQGTMFLAAFPDTHYEIEDLVAEGDKVAVRFTYRGTHRGELMGIPPTGKVVTFTGIAIDRLEKGKIVEHWLIYDALGLMQQLGIIPQSEQAGASSYRQWVEEVFNQRRTDRIDEYIAADFVERTPNWPSGLEGARQSVAVFLTAFPDLHIDVEDVVAQGDKLVARQCATGTHLGEFQGIPPTGKQFNVTGMDMWRVEGGKCAEHWIEMDMLGLLQQLGVIPQPEQEPAPSS